jgi:hypothetical protein
VNADAGAALTPADGDDGCGEECDEMLESLDVAIGETRRDRRDEEFRKSTNRARDPIAQRTSAEPSGAGARRQGMSPVSFARSTRATPSRSALPRSLHARAR